MAVSGKVTPRMAADIRAAAAAGVKYADLAAKYGLHRCTISRVARGVTAGPMAGPPVPPRPKFKIRCHNGHVLAGNRGANYKCRSCSRERSRRRRQKDKLVIQVTTGT